MTSHEDHEEHREMTIETLRAPPRVAKPARFATRIAAGIIDSLILLAIWATVAYATGTSTILGSANGQTLLSPPVFSAYFAALTFIYYSVMEGVFAATVGKLAFKIQVTSLEGDPCSFMAALIRNLVRFLDWLPLLYMIGIATALTSAKRQRLGDRLAKTVVSRAPEKDMTPPPAPFLFH
jgi:uncharacterized RDD family membrane protein YckC